MNFRKISKLKNSTRSHNRLKKQLYSVLENCLERFECRKEDEYHFASSEFVEGIPPFACEFANQSCHNHILAAADEDGRVVIYNSNQTGQNSAVKEWSAHKNAIFDVAWSPSDPHLVTASGDQSAALWDVRTAKCLGSFKQHRCSLKSVSFRPRDSHVFATGSRDGSIMIWDDRSKKNGKENNQLPVCVIEQAHMSQTKKTQPKRKKKLAPDLPSIDSTQSVSVVVFQKEDILLSAGAADGIIKLWDLRMMKSKASSSMLSHQFPYAGTSNRRRGFSSLALTSNRTQLFASCTDSVIYEYDLSGVLGKQPALRYQSHLNSTFFVRAAVSPDDMFLLSGSSDNLAYIWKIGDPAAAPITLVGHEAEVTSVAWCPQDFTKVVTCSDDNTMRIWKMAAEAGSSDGQNAVIGKAERPERETNINSQGTFIEASNNSSQSSILSDTPSRSTETGTLSQQPSPVPPSSKKRKFSLRDWVTTSPPPSTSRQSSTSSASPSPVSPSKRTRSMSTPTSSSSPERGATPGRKRNCDSAQISSATKNDIKRAKVVGEKLKERTGTLSSLSGLEHDRTNIANIGRKRNCDSVLTISDYAKRAKVVEDEKSQLDTTGGSESISNSSRVSNHGNLQDSAKCESVEVNTESSELKSTKEGHIEDSTPTEPNTKSKTECRGQDETEKENKFVDKRRLSPNKSKLKDKQAASSAKQTKHSIVGETKSAAECKEETHHGTNNLPSKENDSSENKSCVFSSKSKSVSKTPSAGQRSPLKDDIPMNKASPSLSKPAKKNLTSYFAKSPKPSKQQIKSLDDQKNVDAIESCPEETKKRASSVRKEKKVDKVHKAVKRRNSAAGTIAGYFSPLVKKQKSESES